MEMTGAREMRLKLLWRTRRLIDMNAKTSMDPGMYSFKQKRDTVETPERVGCGAQVRTRGSEDCRNGAEVQEPNT